MRDDLSRLIILNPRVAQRGILKSPSLSPPPNMGVSLLSGRSRIQLMMIASVNEGIGHPAHPARGWLVSAFHSWESSAIQTPCKAGAGHRARKPSDDLATATLSSILKQSGLKK
jgi:hypothetical protein